MAWRPGKAEVEPIPTAAAALQQVRLRVSSHATCHAGLISVTAAHIGVRN